MIRLAVSLLVSTFLSASPCPSQSRQRERPDLQNYFTEYHVEGTFVLYSVSGDSVVRYNPNRAREAFLPASTFKIFNSMAALEAGSIPNEHTVLKWDSVDRGWEAWNHDQDMKAAFKNSTVWFYQELARRTGAQRLAEWMKREHYGNADTSGGVDRFWLVGGLRISADGQIEFLKKLYHRTLAFKREIQDVALDLMMLEITPEYTLRGKTGWTEWKGKQLGWFVGFIERGDETYIYALNLESPDPKFPMVDVRKRLLRNILAAFYLL